MGNFFGELEVSTWCTKENEMVSATQGVPYLLDDGNLNTWLFNPILNLKTISNPTSKQRDVSLNPKASRDLHLEMGNTPIPTP
jgi:hypothetical protein